MLINQYFCVPNTHTGTVVVNIVNIIYSKNHIKIKLNNNNYIISQSNKVNITLQFYVTTIIYYNMC